MVQKRVATFANLTDDRDKAVRLSMGGGDRELSSLGRCLALYSPPRYSRGSFARKERVPR